MRGKEWEKGGGEGKKNVYDKGRKCGVADGTGMCDEERMEERDGEERMEEKGGKETQREKEEMEEREEKDRKGDNL